eukprot:scaffold23633_cov75-Phaeocystis_antarctica.AAC.2
MCRGGQRWTWKLQESALAWRFKRLHVAVWGTALCRSLTCGSVRASHVRPGCSLAPLEAAHRLSRASGRTASGSCSEAQAA